MKSETIKLRHLNIETIGGTKIILPFIYRVGEGGRTYELWLQLSTVDPSIAMCRPPLQNQSIETWRNLEARRFKIKGKDVVLHVANCEDLGGTLLKAKIGDGLWIFTVDKP